MAQMTIIPTEQELHDSIKVAQDSGERVALEARLASVLAYGFYRYQEICAALREAKLGGGGDRAVRQVCALIGVNRAMELMVQTGFVPRPRFDELIVLLDSWEQWAKAFLHGARVLDPGFSCDSTSQEMRDEISEQMGRLQGVERRSEAEIKGLKAQLDPWLVWAAQHAPRCTSDHEQREYIAARLKSG